MALERRVSLRPIRLDDAPLMTAWWREAAVRRFQPLSTKTLADVRQDLENLSPPRQLLERNGHAFRWIVEADGTPAGWVTLYIESWSRGVAELAYSLSTPYQRQGIMGTAIRLFLAETLAPTGLRRLEARCVAQNVASCRMIEGVGFRLEDPAFESLEVRGKTFDCRLYALDLDDHHRAEAAEEPCRGSSASIA